MLLNLMRSDMCCTNQLRAFRHYTELYFSFTRWTYTYTIIKVTISFQNFRPSALCPQTIRTNCGIHLFLLSTVIWNTILLSTNCLILWDINKSILVLFSLHIFAYDGMANPLKISLSTFVYLLQKQLPENNKLFSPSILSK